MDVSRRLSRRLDPSLEVSDLLVRAPSGSIGVVATVTGDQRIRGEARLVPNLKKVGRCLFVWRLVIGAGILGLPEIVGLLLQVSAWLAARRQPSIG